MNLIDHLLETGRLIDCATVEPDTSEPFQAIEPPGLPGPVRTRPDQSLAGSRDACLPTGVKGIGIVHDYLGRSGLPSRMVGLVYLRVSQLNGCAHSIELNSRNLMKSGMPVEHLVLLPVWRDAGAIFNDREKAALGWTEAVAGFCNHGTAADAHEVAAALFNEKQLADLTIAIGLMTAYNHLKISRGPSPSYLPPERRNICRAPTAAKVD